MNATMEFPRRYHGATRFEIASQADRCVTWLQVNGFEVLRIEASRITIKPSPLCDKLEGVVDGFECIKKRTRRYKMVSRFDCAVVWEVPAPKADSAVVSVIKRLWRRIGGAA